MDNIILVLLGAGGGRRASRVVLGSRGIPWATRAAVQKVLVRPVGCARGCGEGSDPVPGVWQGAQDQTLDAQDPAEQAMGLGGVGAVDGWVLGECHAQDPEAWLGGGCASRAGCGFFSVFI